MLIGGGRRILSGIAVEAALGMSGIWEVGDGIARDVEPDGGLEGRGVRNLNSLPSPKTSSAPASV